ncbi:Endonuclease/exonuclease/phosphatase [Cantharellus anzutake]|uniref:Endonuclease/exonuclease/phosphatase n=1 Tax=Cantharellus anzutake TaxID=1750568 RepID=UPI0019048A4F|nr:Endonuclease/exonuclease/phosphatase [Cantharellus anzutake]KAF8325426.1 Endonuclease/exonuclease/phosphatase [Cantharellus anzutake]
MVRANIRLSSWNLRYDSKPDNITVSHTIANLKSPLVQPNPYNCNPVELPWSTRRTYVSSTLLHERVQLIGFQEALIRQVNDLQVLLSNEWAGEYSPIFFRKSVFNLIDSDTFWLTDTPFKPSKYRGAGSYRVCTVAHLEILATGQRFTLLNTHLDDQSDAQRRLGASLILHRAHYEAVKTKRPVLVTGDFNSSPNGSDSGAYQITTGGINPAAIPSSFTQKYPILSDHGPKFTEQDLKAHVPRQHISGDFATFTGFTQPNNTWAYNRIDFIFGSSRGGWDATSYRVGSSFTDDGVWASDHRPVYVDVTLT